MKLKQYAEETMLAFGQVQWPCLKQRMPVVEVNGLWRGARMVKEPEEVSNGRSVECSLVWCYRTCWHASRNSRGLAPEATSMGLRSAASGLGIVFVANYPPQMTCLNMPPVPAHS